MKIKPLFDRLCVQFIEKENLYIDIVSQTKEHISLAKVVYVSENNIEKISVDDVVLVLRGREYDFVDYNISIIKMSDIVGIINN